MANKKSTPKGSRQEPRFRSGFEKSVYEQAHGKLDFEPEDAYLHYNKPSYYIPDFRLPNGILIECKGRFTSTDRTKMLRVRDQNPGADIRLVFQRANNKLTKSPNSMTYWQWSEKHGFPWAQGSIPEEWWTK